MLIDSTRPDVVSVGLVGDANGDGVLNAAEVGSGPVQLRVESLGVAGGQVRVRNAATQAQLGAVAAAGDSVIVPLSALPTSGDGDVAVEVLLTDANGNTNKLSQSDPLDPVDVEARFTFGLDTVIPTVTLLAPTATVLGPTGDADAAAPGFQLRVQARTSDDVGSRGLGFTLTPGRRSAVTPVELEGQVDFDLGAVGTATYTITVEAVDEAGNVSLPVTRTVTVDLEAPVFGAITSPAPESLHGESALDIQIAVAGADGRPLQIFSRVGTTLTPVGVLTVTAGVASGTLNFGAGTFDLVAQVVDAAGNAAEAVIPNVTVSLSGCAITLTTPATRPTVFLATDDQNPGAPRAPDAAGGEHARLRRAARCRCSAERLPSRPRWSPVVMGASASR